MLIAGVMVAGALGALARFGLDTLVRRRVTGPIPVGTLIINVSGSFVLGLLTGLGLYHGFASAPRVVLGTGFCGAYTTFSTFTYEVVVLADEARWRDAVATLTVGVVGATAAAGIGLALATF